jgi:hypothetical protein
MEKNYAVTGCLQGEEFFVNVFATSFVDAVHKATENVYSYYPDLEFDILDVKEIDSW